LSNAHRIGARATRHVAHHDDQNHHRDQSRNCCEPEDVPERLLIVGKQTLGAVERAYALELEDEERQ